MNSSNETVVSDEMMRKLREAGVDDGYEKVPDDLQDKASRLLRGRRVADMDAEMKRKLRNLKKKQRQLGVSGY